MGALIHLPRAEMFRGPNFVRAMGAIQLSFDRVRDFLEGVVRNCRPQTADVMLDQWATQEPLYGAFGGQSTGYLQDQLQVRWPNVYITPLTFSDGEMCGSAECSVEMCAGFPTLAGLGGAYPVNCYYVRGYVETRTAFNKMVGFIARVFPAHKVALNFVSVLNEDARSEAGLAESGAEQAG